MAIWQTIARTVKHIGIIPVLLSLALAIKLFSTPILMATGEPGKIALCINGQIVYVSADEVGFPSTDEGAVHGDPCPQLGMTAAISIDGPNYPSFSPAPKIATPDLITHAIYHAPLRPLYNSRAPPRSS